MSRSQAPEPSGTDSSPTGPSPSPTAPPRWARRIGRWLAFTVWRTEVVGGDRVPGDGPVVLVANHIGFPDGPVLYGVAPRGPHILVKRQMFVPPLGWILRASGQIPVLDDGGRSALSEGLAVLRDGGVIGVFPEGSRGRGDAASARAGAAWLALNGRAAVVPVAILGTRRTGESVRHVPRPGRELAVWFGEPFRVEREPGVPGKVTLAQANERVRRRLAAVVAEAVRATGIELPSDDPQAVARARGARRSARRG